MVIVGFTDWKAVITVAKTRWKDILKDQYYEINVEFKCDDLDPERTIIKTPVSLLWAQMQT